MFKQTCAGCHFFVRTLYVGRGQPAVLAIAKDSRALASAGDLSWQRPEEALSCHRGIWDEGAGLPESSKSEQVAGLNRRGRCYFMPYQPGMLLPAAEKLQEARLEQTRELQKLRYAAYAVAASLLAILVKMLLSDA